LILCPYTFVSFIKSEQGYGENLTKSIDRLSEESNKSIQPTAKAAVDWGVGREGHK